MTELQTPTLKHSIEISDSKHYLHILNDNIYVGIPGTANTSSHAFKVTLGELYNAVLQSKHRQLNKPVNKSSDIIEA